MPCSKQGVGKVGQSYSAHTSKLCESMSWDWSNNFFCAATTLVPTLLLLFLSHHHSDLHHRCDSISSPFTSTFKYFTFLSLFLFISFPFNLRLLWPNRSIIGTEGGSASKPLFYIPWKFPLFFLFLILGFVVIMFLMKV